MFLSQVAFLLCSASQAKTQRVSREGASFSSPQSQGEEMGRQISKIRLPESKGLWCIWDKE